MMDKVNVHSKCKTLYAMLLLIIIMSTLIAILSRQTKSVEEAPTQQPNYIHLSQRVNVPRDLFSGRKVNNNNLDLHFFFDPSIILRQDHPPLIAQHYVIRTCSRFAKKFIQWINGCREWDGWMEGGSCLKVFC